MSSITKPIVFDETMQATNHLLSQLNASVDILASDKRADLVTDVATIARLCGNDEILEVMDYGDEIHPEWVDGETHYNPAMNLCHVSTEKLEDNEDVRGAFWEWDKTLPFGTQFDAPEATYYFAGTETAGTYHIPISENYGTGWVSGKSIQFTLTSAPDADDQFVLNTATNNANDPTNGMTWTVYAKGGTVAKQTGTTSNGTGGTALDAINSQVTPNGRTNAIQRIVYGYARWAQAGIRQYLNATAATGWWTPQNPWDRPHALASTKPGFLSGYDASVVQYFKPIKVVTVACNGDSNVEDVTYDRVFLSSLEQMYCVPQFSGKEGDYWEYYKRLLGRTTPASIGATYPRLIKYALDAQTTAQICWRRSAARTFAASAWLVGTSGHVNNNYAYYAYRCAPSVFISD